MDQMNCKQSYIFIKIIKQNPASPIFKLDFARMAIDANTYMKIFKKKNNKKLKRLKRLKKLR